MTYRVVANPDGLKVSKPGFNVLTAARANLLFDSSWGVLAAQVAGSANVGNTEIIVPYGKTFPSHPLVFIYYSGVFYVEHTYNAAKLTDYNANTGPNGYFAYYTGLSNIRFRYPNTNDFTYLVHYVVWDHLQ